eukprot:4995206-Prymnesium_polylepis.1
MAAEAIAVPQGQPPAPNFGSIEETTPLPQVETLPGYQPLPLHSMVERLRQELNLEGPVPAVIDEACRVLVIETSGSLVQRARACYVA